MITHFKYCAVELNSRFICLCPELKHYLSKQGYKGEEIANPYDTTKRAWLYPNNETLQNIVNEWLFNNSRCILYNDCNKTVKRITDEKEEA